MADNRWFNLLRTKRDTQGTKEVPVPVNMAGTTPAVPGDLHKSDSLTEQVNTGEMGNDWRTPTPEYWELNADKERYQEIANSHLSEGPTPGRIPHAFNDRNNGKNGRNTAPDGEVGLLLNISGNPAGGMGGALYIPHLSILRPAGHVTGAMRTIDNNAQIPGVFVADTSRR